MKRTIVRAAIALCVSCQLGYASMSETVVNMIKSQQLQDRRDAVEVAIGITNIQEREHVVSLLCAVLDEPQLDNSFDGPLHMAIQVLGEMKLPSAIPCLLPYLTFVPTGYRVEERIPTEWYFPAARALVRIGKPSIKYMEAILDDIGSSDVEKKLAAWVIEEVDGRKVALEKLSKRKSIKHLSNGKTVQAYLMEKKTTFVNPRKQPGWKEGVMSPQKAKKKAENAATTDEKK